VNRGDYINTYTGNKFYPFDPRPEEVIIEDIAHALSMLCRCNGHARFYYSVAQHSLNVAKLLKHLGYNKTIQLYGLLHDGSEAFLSDVITPVKKQLPEYKAIEEKVQNTIWTAFSLPIPSAEEYKIIKHADSMLFYWESKILLEGYDAKYVQMPGYIKIKEDKREKVKREFLTMLEELLK
jgi:hypothetical protein